MSIHVPSAHRAPRTERPRRDWQPVPHINQLHPQGADANYVNGAYNCAPAVVAMLARGRGLFPKLSDAELIQELSKGLIGPRGTTPNKLVEMLERANVHLGGKAMGSTYNDDVVWRQLRRGNMLIAQVGDPNGGEGGAAHYVLVRKALANGNYLVSDPLSNAPYEVTPQQLRRAVRKAPPDGGMLISIGRPGGSGDDRPPPAETFDARASRTHRPNCNERCANPRAFSASEDVFEDVDTRFRNPGDGDLRSWRMRRNETRNEFSMDVSYSQSPYARTRNGQDRPVIPDSEEPKDFARHLRRLKRREDPRAEALFELLEASRFPRDQEVLRYIRERDMQDPGIGKKTWVEQ